MIDEFSMFLTMAFFTSAAAIGEKNQRQKVFDHREMGRCHEDMFGFLFEDGLSFFLKHGIRIDIIHTSQCSILFPKIGAIKSLKEAHKNKNTSFVIIIQPS